MHKTAEKQSFVSQPPDEQAIHTPLTGRRQQNRSALFGCAPLGFIKK